MILPSFLRRRSGSDVGARSTKKPKVVKTWDRDIICLPQSVQNNQQGHNLAFPRGRYRASLAKFGLIGKIHITSQMTPDDVASEIRSVFKGPMGNRQDFPFMYLQSTGGGAKSLMVPNSVAMHRCRETFVERGAKGKAFGKLLAN